MMLMRDRPLVPNLSQAPVSRNSSAIFSPFFSVPAHRINAVTKATSLPAVTSIRSNANTTGTFDQAKTRSHVFLYASMPLDSNGGGTSNITMSAEWCARIPFRSFVRTACAQFSDERSDFCLVSGRHSVLPSVLLYPQGGAASDAHDAPGEPLVTQQSSYDVYQRGLNVINVLLTVPPRLSDKHRRRSE
jgi:hypothetical protein